MTVKSLITLGDCIQLAIEKIANSGSLSPEFDVELLTEFVFGYDRTKQIVLRDQTIPEIKSQVFWQVIERRCAGEPVAYIIGEQEFWSLPFQVNKHTLVPRADTETLVEVVIKRIGVKKKNTTFLDIGTGSGCILLSLLHENLSAKGIGCDISTEALKVARQNAQSLNLLERVQFLEVDVLNDNAATVLEEHGPFECIVSNPPYIPDDDIHELMHDVKDYEPVTALKGGQDGLLFYRRIVSTVGSFLRDGGLLAFEVGIDQADAVASLMDAVNFKQVEKFNDLAGIPRVVSGYYAK